MFTKSFKSMDLSYIPLYLLLVGFVTGAIGSVAGGSVLMTAPLLAALDMPLHEAIATARLSSFGGAGAGLPQFHRAGKISYRLAFEILIWSSLGSIIGANLMLNLSETMLEKVVGIIMLSMLGFGLLNEHVSGLITLSGTMKKCVGCTLFFIAGILGGFFGGQAIVASYLLMTFFDMQPSESIGTRKAIGVAVALITLIIYASWGTINWERGAYLVAGSVLGSWIATRWALKRGETTLKWILNGALIALAAKMLLS